MNSFDSLCITQKDPFYQLLEDHYMINDTNKLLFSFNKVDFTSNKRWNQMIKLLNTPFYHYNDILNIFCNIQKLINTVTRLKWMWRWRKAKIYNTDDLYMTPFCLTDKNVIVLLQNNTKYIFHLRELLQLVKSSLSHCCHFFPDPIHIKNPYTNIPFNKSALYHIYFSIRSSNFTMPSVFEAFFHCNLNIRKFLINNEEIISTEYLTTYVENHFIDNIFDYVKEMFKIHHIKCNIHKDFPKEILMKIMKPYLKLYFISNYSTNNQKRITTRRMLHRKLHKFYNYNPKFGIRKVHLVKNNPFSIRSHCTYYFDETHIKFYEENNSTEYFLRSHTYSPLAPIHTSSSNGYPHIQQEQIIVHYDDENEDEDDENEDNENEDDENEDDEETADNYESEEDDDEETEQEENENNEEGEGEEESEEEQEDPETINEFMIEIMNLENEEDD